MGLLNYMQTGRGLLGNRQGYQLPQMPTSPQPTGPQIAGTMPYAPGRGGRRGMLGGFSGFRGDSGGAGSLGDASGVGGEGYGQGWSNGGPSTREQVETALMGAKPYSDNGQSWVQNQIPSWRDIGGMAMGAAMPMGGGWASLGNLMGLQDKATGRDKFNAAMSIMGGPIGGATKLADWYSGTRYAREHPMASYFNGGNADMGAANAADRAYGAGGNAGFMADIYNLEHGVNNMGGLGTGPGGIGYAGIGNDMAQTLANQVNTGTAENDFLDPAGQYLNAVNEQNGAAQQGGGYAGQAQDIRDTISQQQATGTFDPAVFADLGLDAPADSGSGGGK